MLFWKKLLIGMLLSLLIICIPLFLMPFTINAFGYSIYFYITSWEFPAYSIAIFIPEILMWEYIIIKAYEVS
jgi:hypothetical protein